ncbi:uncharacterized protein LOC131675421 [Phymastichus coffea]|uniref:uncharacterized protein LOC131675421 n=1 Tax=Phymastichus coffea TaxID=108790 RepID=UPI00273ACD13|nr:uncharacterized protein LOC131675421 [Phymastichus coffea]
MSNINNDIPSPGLEQEASNSRQQTFVDTPRWDHSVDLNSTLTEEHNNFSNSSLECTPNPSIPRNNLPLRHSLHPQLAPPARTLKFDDVDKMSAADEDVASVTKCRLPDFWPGRAKLWFYKVEADFNVGRIKSDDSKFNLVIRALDHVALDEVADIIRNPPAQNKYEALKSRILERLADSAEKQLEQMLTCMQLGDKKPSQLYRQMAELAGNNATEDLLKTRWLTLLPQHARNTLKIFKAKCTLQELLDAADAILDSNTSPATLSIDAPSILATHHRAPDFSEIRTLLSELISVSREILIRVSSPPSSPTGTAQHNTSAQRRSRSQSRPRPHANGICYYHNRFGAAASRCSLPCAWLSTNPHQRQPPQSNLNG